MSLEFKDDLHKEQAEHLLLTFGRFNVQFERICEAMRHAIMFALRSQGLKNSGMEQVIIGDTTSVELQVLLGALCNHISGWGVEDKKAVKEVLKHIKELTEQRNVVVHSAWQFGNSSSETELLAVTVRQRTKQNSGAVPEVWGISASYLEGLIDQMNCVQALIQRLCTCLLQPELKVATELQKPL